MNTRLRLAMPGAPGPKRETALVMAGDPASPHTSRRRPVIRSIFDPAALRVRFLV
jgi:hypothetical protein